MMLSTGIELYLERIAKALVWDLQVPLLVLDSSVLAPYVRLMYPFVVIILYFRYMNII